MFTRSLVVTLALLIPASPALAADVDPTTGKIPGYTYGTDAYNSYTAWSGGMPWVWQFSSQHIGYEGSPRAGMSFYIHAHSAVVSPHTVTGNVLLTVDQDAGGVPLRYDASRPTVCTRGQFDPIVATTAIACTTIRAESGQWIVSNLEPLVPGFGIDVQVPFVVDNPGNGTVAMTAMWATSDISLSTANVVASVPVTIGAAPTRPLPKKLRTYKKVRSLTPAVCGVTGRTVVIRGSGACRLKGTKGPRPPRIVTIQL